MRLLSPERKKTQKLPGSLCHLCPYHIVGGAAALMLQRASSGRLFPTPPGVRLHWSIKLLSSGRETSILVHAMNGSGKGECKAPISAATSESALFAGEPYLRAD